MLDSYRRKNDLVVATDYTGIYNDGTSISQANFSAFVTATNGRRVFWPAGTYQFQAGAADINPEADIYWEGEGRATVLSNFEEFSPFGNYVVFKNLRFKDCDYVIRWDATEALTADTVELVEISGVYYQNVKGGFRQPETAIVWPRHVSLSNIIYDTIGPGGAAFQFNGGAGTYMLRDIIVNYSIDSTYNNGITLASEQDGGAGIDTAIYVENLTFTNLWSREGYANPANLYTFYAEAQEGTVIKVEDVKIQNTNLPLIYLRGASTAIYDGIDIRTDTLRSDFEGPVLLSKTRRQDQEPAMIMRNSVIIVPNITAFYKENIGDVWLYDNYLENAGVGVKYTVNVSVGEVPAYPMTVLMHGNTIKNRASSNNIIGSFPAQIQRLEMYNNKFIVPSGSIPSGANGLLIAGANVNDTMQTLIMRENYFYGVRMNAGTRYIRNAIFENNEVIGSGTHGFGAFNSSVIRNNIFRGFDPDSIVGVGGGATYDWNLYTPNAQRAEFIGNTFDLDNFVRVCNVDIGQAGYCDSLIMNYNTGRIKAQTGNGSKMVRVDSVNYLEMVGNTIEFPTANPEHVVFVENAINFANISGNSFHASGTVGTRMASQGRRVEMISIDIGGAHDGRYST